MTRLLLIDVGNSRVKWALAVDGRLGRQRALPIGAGGALPVRALCAALPDRLDGVRIVSVARQRATQALSAALARATGADVRVLATTARAAGVRCGYAEPWRLGADRWAAVIGAHHLYPRARAASVVDIGTALTVDYVSRSGRHGGGAIVPGPVLMVASLLGSTQGIRARAAQEQEAGRALFAHSTQAAIVQGSRHAAAAFIEHAQREARRRYGGRPVLLISGGGAAEVLPYLKVACRVVPDLVLRGLLALG